MRSSTVLQVKSIGHAWVELVSMDVRAASRATAVLNTFTAESDSRHACRDIRAC